MISRVRTAQCVHCAKPFMIRKPQRGPIQRYCSARCQRAAYRARRLAADPVGTRAYIARRVREYYKRKRAARIASSETIKLQYAQVQTCVVCDKKYQRVFTQAGLPRKNEPITCGNRCNDFLYRFTHGIDQPSTRQRICPTCGVTFIPRRNNSAIYCTHRCMAKSWAQRHPEIIAACVARTEERHAKKYREERAAYLASPLYQQHRLIRLLRQIRTLKNRAEVRAAKHAKPCRTCGTIVVRKYGGHPNVYCSSCQKTANRDARRRDRRRRRARDQAELRPQYLKKEIAKRSALSYRQMPTWLLDMKREQLMFYRQMKEVQNEIRSPSKRQHASTESGSRTARGS